MRALTLFECGCVEVGGLRQNKQELRGHGETLAACTTSQYGLCD